MKFEFKSVSDKDLIAPALIIIANKKNNLSTSSLIKLLKENSIVPSKELEILKNRTDNKFSQKIRNLISHKVLEKNFLAKVDNNNIELNYYGKKIGNYLIKKFSEDKIIHIDILNGDRDYKKILLMAKFNINFDPFYFEKLNGIDFSLRTKNTFKKLNIKFVGDLVTNVTKKDILSQPGSGKITVDEIENFLVTKNLKFGEKSNWNDIQNKDFLFKEYLKNKINVNEFNLDDLLFELLRPSKKQSPESFLREKKIIISRFAINEEFKTLEAIAKNFHITRERVRQIQQSFVKKIKNNYRVSYSVKKLINFIKSQTPVQETVLSKLLIKENFFNSSKSIPALRNIISAFEKYTFDNYSYFNLVTNIDSNENRNSEDFLISNNKEKKILSLIISHSGKRTTKYSYCNFENMISDIFKTRNFSKFKNIKESLKNDDNFLWFDDNNFITLGSKVGRQRVLNILKKLLIIQKKISFEDFRDSLLNNIRIGHAPPIELLQKICKQQNFKFDNDYIYYSGEDYELGELDKNIGRMFKENGDYLGFWECMELAEKYKFNLGSLNMYLYGHSTVKRLDNQIFCLFGTEFNKEKYDNAVERTKKMKNKEIYYDEINWTINKDVLIKLKLTKNLKLRGYIYIPIHWLKILEGSFYNYDNKTEIIVGGAVWNLKEIFSNYNENDQLNLFFNINLRTLKVTKSY